MNTNMCFVFLLAIGLSAQKEFQADFDKMVNAVKLKGGKTLLHCPENCNEVKETACKCVHFDHCKNSTVSDCIKTGLRKFNLTILPGFEYRVDQMLMKLTNEVTPKWHTLVSPKSFLNYIQELRQKSNASVLRTTRSRVRRGVSKKKA